MIHLTIPVETRTLANMVIAEMQTVSRAFGGSWTTPEALQQAYHATERLRLQMAALTIQIRRMEADQ